MTAPGGPGGRGRPPPGYLEHLARALRLPAALSAARGRDLAIATTPKTEVWRDGKASLHRYDRATPPDRGPLILLHGLIGRQTVTDLEPERSLVRRLLDGGADLFVLDWGSPSRADAFLDFTDYADLLLGDAVLAARRVAGRRPALMGICQGGVFALIQAAHHPDRIAGLIPCVTPVDFHAAEGEPGLLNHWARALPEDALARLIDACGVIPGQVTGALFQGLQPARTAAKYGPDLAARADDAAALDTFLRLERWLADRPDHPAAAAKEWLIRLYGRNDLVHRRFEVSGRVVDLGRIACPVLNIWGREDHIVPPAVSRALRRHLAPDLYRALPVAAGHIGVFVSDRARERVAPAILDFLQGLDFGSGG